MKHFKVIWKHSFPDEPVVIFCEIDDSRYEVRKIEIYANGTKGFALGEFSVNGTELGLFPTPELSEIAQNPEFEPSEISAEAFEREWALRETVSTS